MSSRSGMLDEKTFGPRGMRTPLPEIELTREAPTLGERKKDVYVCERLPIRTRIDHRTGVPPRFRFAVVAPVRALSQ